MYLLLLSALALGNINNPKIQDRFDGAGHFREQVLAANVHIDSGKIVVLFESSGGNFASATGEFRVPYGSCCTIVCPASEVVQTSPNHWRMTWNCHNFAGRPQELSIVLVKTNGLKETRNYDVCVHHGCGGCCNACPPPCPRPRLFGRLVRCCD